MTDWAATVLVGIVIAVGIAGVVLPVLPGLWLIWVAALVYGFLVGFDGWAWPAMVAMTALAVAGTAIVYYLPAKKTGEAGIPGWGQFVIAACAIVGFFVIPIVGAIIGVVVGTLGVAVIVERDLRSAGGTAWVLLVEVLKAAAIQLAIALTMAVVWGAWAFTVLN